MKTHWLIPILFCASLSARACLREQIDERAIQWSTQIVEAKLLAADAEGDGVSGAIVDVATGRSATVNELADTIGSILGKPVEKEYLPPREGDVRDSLADVGETRRLLGYEPRIGLEEGLRRTVDALVRA